MTRHTRKLDNSCKIHFSSEMGANVVRRECENCVRRSRFVNISVSFDSARMKENETITSIRTPTEMTLVSLVIPSSSTRKDVRASDSKDEMDLSESERDTRGSVTCAIAPRSPVLQPVESGQPRKRKEVRRRSSCISKLKNRRAWYPRLIFRGCVPKFTASAENL